MTNIAIALSAISGGLIGLACSFGVAWCMDTRYAESNGPMCWTIGSCGTLLGVIVGLIIVFSL